MQKVRLNTFSFVPSLSTTHKIRLQTQTHFVILMDSSSIFDAIIVINVISAYIVRAHLILVIDLSRILYIYNILKEISAYIAQALFYMYIIAIQKDVAHRDISSHISRTNSVIFMLFV